MVSFQVISDLHLEFGEVLPLPIPKADVLILAGDIGSLETLRPFLDRISEGWDLIIYVPGNHEYYSIGKTKESIFKELKELEGDYPSLKVMDMDVVEYKGQRFVGCTLWSSPSTQRGINDFKWIFTNYYGDSNSSQNITLSRMKEWNNTSKKFIKETVKEGDIVITHFMPKYRSFKPEYTDKHNYYGNEGLEDVMKKAKVWVSGHTHCKFDVFDECRWVCNASGYPEEDTGCDVDFIVE